MGWRSTLSITKRDALAEIMKAILDASDEGLENILLALHQDKPYNYKIVSVYQNDDDHSYNHLYDGL